MSLISWIFLLVSLNLYGSLLKVKYRMRVPWYTPGNSCEFICVSLKASSEPSSLNILLSFIEYLRPPVSWVLFNRILTLQLVVNKNVQPKIFSVIELYSVHHSLTSVVSWHLLFAFLDPLYSSIKSRELQFLL